MMKISGKKVFGQISVIFLSLFFVSCAAKEEQAKLRIVDLQGKSHPLNTRVPEGNLAAMSNQNRMAGQSMQPQEAPQTQVTQESNPDYGLTIQNTFQPQPKPVDNSLKAAQVAPAKEETIEYDLSEEEVKVEKPVAKKEAKKSAAKKSVAAKGKQKGLFVQVGSFSSIASAKQTLSGMEKFHKGHVETVKGKKTIYRVLLGPFSSKQDANALVAEIKEAGHEAVLMRNK